CLGGRIPADSSDVAPIDENSDAGRAIKPIEDRQQACWLAIVQRNWLIETGLGQCGSRVELEEDRIELQLMSQRRRARLPELLDGQRNLNRELKRARMRNGER